MQQNINTNKNKAERKIFAGFVSQKQFQALFKQSGRGKKVQIIQNQTGK